jgi:hypothetical protein
MHTHTRSIVSASTAQGGTCGLTCEVSVLVGPCPLEGGKLRQALLACLHDPGWVRGKERKKKKQDGKTNRHSYSRHAAAPRWRSVASRAAAQASLSQPSRPQSCACAVVTKGLAHAQHTQKHPHTSRRTYTRTHTHSHTHTHTHTNTQTRKHHCPSYLAFRFVATLQRKSSQIVCTAGLPRSSWSIRRDLSIPKHRARRVFAE